MRERVYKEVTLQQMRSFAETARLGSMTAAARALGITLPTVWTQVRALEQDFAEPLVEAHGRGCRLTEAGRLLAEIIGPLVAGAAALKTRFRTARALMPARLTVAVTVRILTEDLPPCLLEFHRRHPHVQMVFRESRLDEVAVAVESGAADLGLTFEPTGLVHRPLLELEPAYELEYFLYTPKGHPLARRRRLRLSDLQDYALVHSPGEMQAAARATLERFRHSSSPIRSVEAAYAASIRRLVELGFGIGLIACLPDAEAPPNLAMRNVGRLLGRVPVYFLWRRRAEKTEPAGAFAEIVKTMLNVPAGRRGRPE